MRAAAELEERVRTLVGEELQRRLAREVLPHLCVHNHRQPLDHRRQLYGEINGAYNRISAGIEDGVALPVLQTIGLCMIGAENPESWGGAICEEPIDAQRCPYFVYRRARAEVYAELVTELRDPDWVQAHLPAVHWLLWAVGAPGLEVQTGVSRVKRLWRRVLQFFSKGAADRKSVV